MREYKAQSEFDTVFKTEIEDVINFLKGNNKSKIQ